MINNTLAKKRIIAAVAVTVVLIAGDSGSAGNTA